MCRIDMIRLISAFQHFACYHLYCGMLSSSLLLAIVFTVVWSSFSCRCSLLNLPSMLLFLLSLPAVVDAAAFFSIINSIFITTTIISGYYTNLTKLIELIHDLGEPKSYLRQPMIGFPVIQQKQWWKGHRQLFCIIGPYQCCVLIIIAGWLAADLPTPTETFVVSTEAGKTCTSLTRPNEAKSAACGSPIFGCWTTGKVITGCLN